eukprot:Awhi_evm1s14419
MEVIQENLISDEEKCYILDLHRNINLPMLETVLNDEKATSIFLAFLNSQYCLENYEMYHDVDDFERMFLCRCPNIENHPQTNGELPEREDVPLKTVDYDSTELLCEKCVNPANILKKCSSIYEEFFTANSEREINLDSPIKEEIVKNYQAFCNRLKSPDLHFCTYTTIENLTTMSLTESNMLLDVPTLNESEKKNCDNEFHFSPTDIRLYKRAKHQMLRLLRTDIFPRFMRVLVKEKKEIYQNDERALRTTTLPSAMSSNKQQSVNTSLFFSRLSAYIRKKPACNCELCSFLNEKSSNGELTSKSMSHETLQRMMQGSSCNNLRNLRKKTKLDRKDLRSLTRFSSLSDIGPTKLKLKRELSKESAGEHLTIDEPNEIFKTKKVMSKSENNIPLISEIPRARRNTSSTPIISQDAIANIHTVKAENEKIDDENRESMDSQKNKNTNEKDAKKGQSLDPVLPNASLSICLSTDSESDIQIKQGSERTSPDRLPNTQPESKSTSFGRSLDSITEKNHIDGNETKRNCFISCYSSITALFSKKDKKKNSI